MSGRSAVVIGATGEVGKRILQEVLQSSSFTRVGEYGRRVTALEKINTGKDKLEQKAIDFEKIGESGLKDGQWDVVFVALGTTRAAAGSAAQFEKIDREYVVNAAKEAKVGGKDQRLVYISSGSANPKSMFLYPKSKGLTELELATLGYDMVSLRPGLLVEVNRKERGDSRLLESLAISLYNSKPSWFSGLGVETSLVAKAARMVGLSGSAGIPAVANALKAGGAQSPFTVIDNNGIRAMTESEGGKL